MSVKSVNRMENVVNKPNNVAPNPANQPAQPNLSINLQSVPNAAKTAYDFLLLV